MTATLRLFVFAGGAWVSMCSAAPASDQAGVRTVLALYWSTEDFPSNRVIDSALREAFHRPDHVRIDYHAEYLESDRFPGSAASLAFRDYLKGKYRGRHIDVVVTIADVALQFAIQHRDELFPDAPIVASGLTPPDRATREAGAGITGVVTGNGFGKTLELVLRLHPSVERVFVIADASDEKLQAQMQRQVRSFESTVSLTYLSNLSVDELLSAVRKIPERSLVLFIRYSREAPGQVLFPSEVAKLVAEASPVPVYGVAESYLGSGVVGGSVHRLEVLASRLADMTVRIAGGVRAQDVPIEEAPLVAVFDARQLRHWRIDASRIPRTATILFRPFSALETYRWYIAGAAGVFILQGVMIGTLVVLHSRRRSIEARNTAILQAMPDMMFLQTRDGVYVDYHTPDDRLLLIPPDQFLGKNMRSVLPEELLDMLTLALEQAALGRQTVVVEYDLHFQNALRHYEARLVPCDNQHVLSVVRDITERRQAEAALLESQERYALATAAGRVGVWDWNLDTNEIYVDPALKAILGFQDHEITNHLDDWGRRVHPDDVAAVMERARAHLDGETPIYEVEHRMLHKNGSVRWFLARGSVVERKDGRPVRVTGTDTDVTGRKLAEQALHETQRDLERVSRLTSRGEFAASIAHEVSQPLTAIVMNAQTCLKWLARPSPDLGGIREALVEVVDAVKRADEVIRRNRELFRHHTVEKALIDINAVIKEVAVLAHMRLQSAHVRLEMHLADELPLVMGDRVELEQVLLNLIVNGIDAMEGIDPSARELSITSEPGLEGVVQVTVRDTGVGLQGVDVDRMFAPAYTTKPAGSGVGLSISRSIIEVHGGKLWARQNEGPGASLCFTVPVRGASQAPMLNK